MTIEWRLSRAFLNDPAFSSDPRSHPHFPLPFNPLPPIPPTKLIPPKANTIIPRKATMKALVRRLTSRHDLDRIDELDETDPFGGSYHHDGPYEAIGTNHAIPTTPRIHSVAAPRRTNIHHSKREFVPRSLHPAQHQSAPRIPSVHGENGLSLHLKPGQILQHNAIYTSHASSATSVPSHFPPQSNTVAIQHNHSRSQSPPAPRSRSLGHSSLHLLDHLHNQPSSFSRAPPHRYLEDNAPDIPNIHPLHHDRDTAPYALSQTEMTVFPPPRYESRLHDSGSSRPPQRTPSLSFKPTPRKTRATESAISDPRHKSVHSLDSSHTINTTHTQSSSSTQNNSLERPRIRHLPKRLVMPAPLQPQPPQPQYKFPTAEPVTRQDEYTDYHTLEGASFEGPPAMYTQGPRVLRKKSSAFPEKMPIPHLVPMPQNDAVPIIGTTPSKTANEAEGTKEKIRRRRLSKRKNDI